MAEISPARAAAFRILCRLHEKPDDQTPLPVLLEESGKTLSSRDAALAAEIIYGVMHVFSPHCAPFFHVRKDCRPACGSS